MNLEIITSDASELFRNFPKNLALPATIMDVQWDIPKQIKKMVIELQTKRKPL